jgi:hypothetical protein
MLLVLQGYCVMHASTISCQGYSEKLLYCTFQPYRSLCLQQASLCNLLHPNCRLDDNADA